MLRVHFGQFDSLNDNIGSGGRPMGSVRSGAKPIVVIC